MKFKTITLVPILCIVFALMGASTSAQIKDFQVYAENLHLALYVNPDNGEFVIKDKRTDVLWYSNPPNRKTEEKVARGTGLQQLGSQFSIAYFTPGDNLRYMNNRADSVEFGQFELIPIENGVRLEFTLGRRWEDDNYLPVMISRARFEELILANIDKQEQRLFESSYELVKLEIAASDYEKLEIYRLDKEALFGEYTLVNPMKKLKPNDHKAVIELVADQIVANRSDLADRRGLTADDFSQFKQNETYVLKNKIRNWDREDMIEILKRIGYTPEDVIVDHGENHLDPPRENYRTFQVAIEYTIEDDNFVVRVPLDDVVYPENVLDDSNVKVTLPLYSISLLEYFGAGGPADQGYIFVPDGSGAIINFNNGKVNSPPYMQQVYGIDPALNPRKERTSYQNQVHLPVFGLKHEDRALFGMIDKGETYVRIKADVAGRASSYNTAYPEIVVLPVAKTQLQGSVEIVVEGQVFRNEINVYQKRKNSGDVIVRYAFLGEEQASYVGMARTYQDQLIKQHSLRRLQPKDDLPFYLELVGAVHATEPVLGIPRTVIKPLTTYEQGAEIIDELLTKNVGNLKVRYSGWLAGGLKHKYPGSLSLEKHVGTKEDLETFGSYLAAQGIDLFLDVNFINIQKHGTFDGFIPLTSASRYLNRQVARTFDYDLGTYKLDPKRPSYVLSPGKLEGLVQGFMHDFTALPVDGISLRGLGMQVSSDFREAKEKLVDREQSLAILSNQLDFISGEELKILVDGGNAYALPYADSIVNLPLESSLFSITDGTVPFLPIVLHGYINYAGEPVNLAQDYRTNLLRTIEAGASPYYLWTFVDPSVLKDSNFTYLYSTNYRHWLDEASEFYRRSNEVLREVQGQVIVDHIVLAPQVYGTKYESGDVVVVNYQDEAVWLDGVEVPGLDFILFKGGI